ncbi:MAG TPA: hypothetical protein PLR76_09925 [Hyphomonas sp.]|nr:hypothetical protein [Hyphomonas sp.]
MTDTPTALADVIVPEVFNPYVVQKSIERSAFFQSGVITDMRSVPGVAEQMMGADPGIDGGGTTVNLPFFNDLDGDSEVLDDTADLTINKITTGKDVAAKLMRAKVFGATDLAADLAGADPMMAIGDRFADYWTREYQTILFKVLAGTINSTVIAANVSDISALSGALAYFDGEAFIDACGKLGDRQDELAMTAVHSDTYNYMKKQDLIDFVKPSEAADAIPFYQNKRVIVDDGCPKASGGIYTTYLFGQGAVAWAAGSPKVPTEPGREPLKGGGQSYLVNRNKFLMHIRGIKWAPGSGVPAKPTPSNAELAASGNWSRVYDAKNIRVVAFKHKLG